MKPLTLHISPCPNDTFAFDAIINRRLEHDFDLAVEYKDIEELNLGVIAGEPDISKISYSVYPKIADRYAILDSGSALGRGNGQLLVRRKGEQTPIRTVASPGLNTTANALLLRYFPEVESVTPMLFSDIAAAVERGDVDAGVLIHEGRFVYHRRNLELVADLGKLWEAETALPLPLGAIVIKRTIAEDVKSRFEALLAESVRYAQAHPTVSRDFVKAHAQELEDGVIDSHIALFVNHYTVTLGAEGREAVKRLIGACERGDMKIF
ncbi:MAG: 1,4-dihydroxy-6-naphthoate synthase [Alistipes sp.]|nr:1,4-dihydroxy-6-naphthoate synthase [Alistipes sp.]